MFKKINDAYDQYLTFLIGIFIGRYYNKEQITKKLVHDLSNKITFQNLDAFKKFSVILVIIETLLIFLYDLPNLEKAPESGKFLYSTLLNVHLLIIAVTLLCNLAIYIPSLSVNKLYLHHKMVVQIHSFLILATCAYLDALNYYATKSVSLFVVMFIQLTILIFSLHFLFFHLSLNFILLLFFIHNFNAFDIGAIRITINIGILLIFAYISGYFKLRSFVRNEIIEKQKQALDVQTKLTQSFARFVPKEFLYFLNKKDILDVELGDQVAKQMSILFSDMRSFTTISEKMTPQENFNFLNEYFKAIGPIIRANKGFVDKYIGDAVMALFSEKPDTVIDAALAMQNKIREFNSTKPTNQQVSIGVGIHFGNLMLGTIGEENRLQNTVISDAVNLASRIESLTKYYGVEILISDTLLNHIRDTSKYKYRVIDTVIVKGKNESVKLIEILNPATKKGYDFILQNEAKFEKAMELYKKKAIKKALLIFEELNSGLKDSDKVYSIYVERCNKLLKSEIPEDWNEITKFDEK